MGIQITMTAAKKSFYRCLALGICVTLVKIFAGSLRIFKDLQRPT